MGFEASRVRPSPSDSFFGAGARPDGVAIASISFDESGAGLGSRGAGGSIASSFGGGSASVTVDANASFSFGSEAMQERIEIARPPSPEVKTSGCFSCIRGFSRAGNRL